MLLVHAWAASTLLAAAEKKRDERAHSKFAKGPDGTTGVAEGSRPLAAAASLVAALAIAG